MQGEAQGHLCCLQMESRRITHISAEQKRRFNIKLGFDTLHSLVSTLSAQPSIKVSTQRCTGWHWACRDAGHRSVMTWPWLRRRAHIVPRACCPVPRLSKGARGPLYPACPRSSLRHPTSATLQVSKATTLQKTAEYICKLQQERAALQDEAQRLREQIEELNSSIK